MNYRREEIWFARIVMILGVKELVDALLNLATLVKVHSGLPIVAASADGRMAATYLCSSGAVALYLLAGGGLLSRMAHGRRVPMADLRAETGLPGWAGALEVTLEAFGAEQMIEAVGSIALAIATYATTTVTTTATAPRIHVIHTAWALEHVLLGVVLLGLGGRLARWLVGRSAAAGVTTPEA